MSTYRTDLSDMHKLIYHMKWVLYALFSWLIAGHWFAYVLGPAKQSKICVIYTNYPAEYQGNKAKCDARQALTLFYLNLY